MSQTLTAQPHPSSLGARLAIRQPVGASVGRGAAVLARQLALVLGAALAYFAVRGLTESGVEIASAHAHQVLRIEHSLGIDVESTLQNHVLGHRWLVTAANWVYIWGHWPVITATLVWLHRRDRSMYRLLRNALFVSGAIGLVIFARYPVAPPRLLGTGIADTVTNLSHSYRVLQPPALVNKYAAVPSLHVGWNLLVGVFIARHAVTRLVRRLGLVSPALMILAVVVTGNHYVLDAVAGMAVALTGLVIADRAPRLLHSTAPSRLLARLGASPHWARGLPSMAGGSDQPARRARIVR